MTKLILDPGKSNVRLRTFAEGLFSRLAHDLELVCRDASGAAERAGDGKGSVTLLFPVERIDVHGTLKDGRVDPDGLSPSDRADCLAKMRKDVFHVDGAPSSTIRVEATLEAGKARVRVAPPRGRTVERAVTVRVEPADGAGARVSGAFELSLNELGAAPVKGPMNAFRVKDTIEILFDLVFGASG